MENIISRITEINDSAEAIVNDISAKKQEVSKEADEKTAAFDKALADKTSSRIDQMSVELKQEMNQELAALRKQATAQLNELEANYQANHTQMAKDILTQLITDR